MKKLIALLLCAILVLATAACSAPEQPSETTGPEQMETTQPTTLPAVTQPTVTEPPVTKPVAHEKFDLVACKPIRGTWSTTIKLDADLLNLERFTEETSFQLYYSFDKHGQFCAYVDMEEFTDAIDSYEEKVIQHMVDLRYSQYKTTMSWKGHSTAKINEMWAAGPEAEARSASTDTIATMNLYHRFLQLTREGLYYVEDGTLFTQLTEDTFEGTNYVVKGSELTLQAPSNSRLYSSLSVEFPLVFTHCE